jgi:hypothetical protein
MSVAPILELLTETDVLGRWPSLTARELRRARKANPPGIAFYDFPKRQGGPCYTVAQVQEYIDRNYLRVPPCEKQALIDSRSETTTSSRHIPIAVDPGTPAGMTSELAKSAAEAFANEILNRPKSNSRSSSPRPRRQRTTRLALVKS